MRTTLFMALSATWLLLTPLSASAQGNETSAPQAGGAASAPAATPAAAPVAPLPPNPSPEQIQAYCRARLKEYQESLACFAPYRHSAHVIDVEAYKHCKVVKEPTDCLAEGMQ